MKNPSSLDEYSVKDIFYSECKRRKMSITDIMRASTDIFMCTMMAAGISLKDFEDLIIALKKDYETLGEVVREDLL